ncbi:hypothetical protein NW768_005986 [Fusarium equiseti]|uniref:Uncharacterized protein n=1 Tax=Fusarium equiseti TaxID=61235 RepID=A0ABQ8RDE5_FUSEQ|nr:hypothetical protein NW768_005986 [Fusarium equiseti]
MLDERSRSNSHRTLAVHRVEDNEVGSNSRSKLSPAPVRSLKRKSNFYQKKPSFNGDNKESSVEEVGDFWIQHDRSTFEIRTRDKSDLEDDESDLEVRLISGYKDDESVLEDDESVLVDDELVLRDDESDLEEFPMRNTAFKMSTSS